MDGEYEVLVIGTGPGGEGAAMQAVKHGRTVAVIERDPLIGGSCTHRGTIPSKALRYAIFQVNEANSNPLFREKGLSIDLPLSEIRRRAKNVIDQQVRLRTTFYDRNDVPVFHGQAKFIDEHSVEVLQPDGGRNVLRGQHLVIATGARPYRPPHVDFSHPRIFDSDTILQCDHDIKCISIFGAGVIGCEYASMFRNLEMKVNLINNRDRLLDFLDEEIVDALSYHLRERG
ncbi:MAG TPA: FAD-dependent oxidoreductase, partial [Planctomycetaceae bacterium]|nr:FAD-dependent oxidoreductase [Planctomycetaceae bacterium]